jgi:uncharacterized Tic20 family protein
MNEKDLAAMIHIIGPFTFGIAALLIWLTNKEKSDFVDAHGKAFLNYFIIAFFVAIVGLTLSAVIVGKIILLTLLAYAIFFGIIAFIKSFKGEYYEYPFIIRIIK